MNKNEVLDKLKQDISSFKTLNKEFYLVDFMKCLKRHLKTTCK